MASEPRIVVVPDAALGLLRRAGITPPANASDKLDISDVDTKMATAGFSVTEKLQTKGALRDVGLLTQGKPIRDRMV